MTQVIIIYDQPAGKLTTITAESYADAAQQVLDNLGISLFTEPDLKEFDADLYAEYRKL